MNWIATGCAKVSLFGQIKCAAGVMILISLFFHRRPKPIVVLRSAAALVGWIFVSLAGVKIAYSASND